MTTRRAMDIDKMREKLLQATLPHVPFDGWSDAAIRAGAEDAGLSPAEALNAFPAGPAEALRERVKACELEAEAIQQALLIATIAVPEGAWPGIVKRVSFAEMKKEGERYAPLGGRFWEGGANTFLNKGTNGRWKDVLSAEELALYDSACGRTLSPECRSWLEDGGHP